MKDFPEHIQSYFPVNHSEAMQIASQFRSVSIKKGDFFLKESSYCQEIGFLGTGLMRIYRQTDRKEVTQWISTPGYFVTDLASFVFETPARWHIEALTDAELLVIHKKEYDHLHKIVPSWKELDKLFIARCFVILEERIFQHLHLSAEERFKELLKVQPALFNQVPLQYLASMLGMTPETLSRLRNKLPEKSIS